MPPKTPNPKSQAAKAARAAKPAGEAKAPRTPRVKPAAEVGAMADQVDGAMAAPDGEEASDKAAPAAAVVKLKHLIDQVAEATGGKRQDVKPIIEATLAQLGAALGRGENLSLQGFGNLRVAKAATADNPVIRLKLRLTEGGKTKAQSVEED